MVAQQRRYCSQERSRELSKHSTITPQRWESWSLSHPGSKPALHKSVLFDLKTSIWANFKKIRTFYLKIYIPGISGDAPDPAALPPPRASDASRPSRLSPGLPTGPLQAGGSHDTPLSPRGRLIRESVSESSEKHVTYSISSLLRRLQPRNRQMEEMHGAGLGTGRGVSTPSLACRSQISMRLPTWELSKPCPLGFLWQPHDRHDRLKIIGH